MVFNRILLQLLQMKVHALDCYHTENVLLFKIHAI